MARNALTALTINDGGNESTVEIREDEIITFSDGLVGCDSWRRFVMLEDPDNNVVSLLQCVDEPAVSFLVTDPSLVCAGYDLEINPADRQALGLKGNEDAIVLCILVVRESPMRVTANLLGPLVVNRRTRQGKQFVLADSLYSARHPVNFAIEDA